MRKKSSAPPSFENDPRFLARVARARASLREGRGVPWEDDEAETSTTEFVASDKPRRPTRRR